MVRATTATRALPTLALHRNTFGCVRTSPPPFDLETAMTWETPAAIDFRFGFEITMYVAAR
ncbi:pyrroloquinoline quinone precursor peptide PqqA [Sphaerotilus mobilis]|uniref:Coenzyme PQQ synthesis protein A n=1 Tax=Sphaerotilus mobilis TaxID=47994 RepID=A0A4Q7LKV2_9BURK|nr:pyrroloquinoline quinone precursor peptide PqqA [Sphaerotilus mobilis]RZS54447.1 pyrroloquinoline quinone biosynthesis protein A [Sphaerotilus mobilis]